MGKASLWKIQNLNFTLVTPPQCNTTQHRIKKAPINGALYSRLAGILRSGRDSNPRPPA